MFGLYVKCQQPKGGKLLHPQKTGRGSCGSQRQWFICVFLYVLLLRLFSSWRKTSVVTYMANGSPDRRVNLAPRDDCNSIYGSRREHIACSMVAKRTAALPSGLTVGRQKKRDCSPRSAIFRRALQPEACRTAKYRKRLFITAHHPELL